MDSASYEDVVKSMRGKAIEFDMHLDKVKKLNNELLEKTETIIKSINDLVGSVKPAKKNCSVCYTRERSVTLVPCGHLFCLACAERAQRTNRCFICRSRILDSMKVFP